MANRRLFSLLVVVLLALGLVVPLMFGGTPSLVVLHAVPWYRVFFLVGVIGLVCCLDVWRSWLLLSPRADGMTFSRTFLVYLVVIMAACVTPFGSMAPLAALILLRPYGVRFGVLMAVFLTVTLLDALSLLLLLAVIAIYLILSSSFTYDVMLADLCALLLLVVMAGVGFYKYQSLFVRLAGKGLAYGGVSRKKLFGMGRTLVRFRYALDAVLGLPVKKRLLLLLVSLLYWSLYSSAMFFSALAVGHDVGWVRAVLIDIVSLLSGHLTTMPGGMVGTESMGIFLLYPLVGTSSAASIVLLWRFLTFYLYLVAGLIALLFVRRDVYAGLART